MWGLAASFVCTACVPFHVSGVALHTRDVRPVVVESVKAENYGAFSCPAFDREGKRLAVYDSGLNRLRILRSADLAELASLEPARRPRRLGFSPSGRFLVIEAHPGWIDDYLGGKGIGAPRAAIDSPAALRDDIQRATIWDLKTGRMIADLCSDTISTRPPQGGWLWARRWAIVPGYRSAALLEAHFSPDETEFSLLAWNGVRQRWDVRTWMRLADLPPPVFWAGLHASAPASATRSADGRWILLQSPGFPTLYLWDTRTDDLRPLMKEHLTRLPVQAISSDGRRVVVVGNQGMSPVVRSWGFLEEKERPLEELKFGLMQGHPRLRGEGVALSPDGQFLAAALLDQEVAMFATILITGFELTRSDLCLWRVDDGRLLVTVSLEDLSEGMATGPLQGLDLVFSPDGTTLAVCGRMVRIYRVSELVRSP
ncbi:hypothetical protein IMCC26134_00140 [Verrucomicrobia bacterium IMCC26134]|nr:hypothetical protein IMCC26134_00140 [Verrucomicrobia bacterium IMCC26134]